jgi:hypothetical protein
MDRNVPSDFAVHLIQLLAYLPFQRHLRPMGIGPIHHP